MTEEQIERKIERATDYLDRQLMAGTYTQAEYDRKMAELNDWSEREYRKERRRQIVDYWQPLSHVAVRVIGSR